VFATGFGIIAVLMFLPGGLGELVFRLRDRWLRFIALRRNLYVPSLVADLRVADSAEVAAQQAKDDAVLRATAESMSSLSAGGEDGGGDASPAPDGDGDEQPVPAGAGARRGRGRSQARSGEEAT
jgi:hypothetical protein